MAVVVFVIGVIVGMAMLIFAFENTEPITLRYLFTWQTQPIPLFLVIMAAVGVGGVVAGLFGLAAYLRGRRISRDQRRSIAASPDPPNPASQAASCHHDERLAGPVASAGLALHPRPGRSVGVRRHGLRSAAPPSPRLRPSRCRCLSVGFPTLCARL